MKLEPIIGLEIHIVVAIIEASYFHQTQQSAQHALHNQEHYLFLMRAHFAAQSNLVSHSAVQSRHASSSIANIISTLTFQRDIRFRNLTSRFAKTERLPFMFLEPKLTEAKLRSASSAHISKKIRQNHFTAAAAKRSLILIAQDLLLLKQ
jgi:hypothetical protein